jgi:glycosyltransferase involved in cell wall biosynthesis
VLVTIPSLSGGGEERMAVHLVNNLDRARFAPVLALGIAEGPYLKDVHPDVPVVELGAARGRGVVPALVKRVRQDRPDVVVSLLGFNLAAVVARPFFPRGTRLVLRLGSTASAFLAEVALGNRPRALAYRALHRVLFPRADAVVCQCDYMRDDLVVSVGVPRSNLLSIYNPVDVAAIARSTESGGALYPGPGPHLVTVGNMSYAKGYDLLLPAFEQARRRHRSATLTIVGRGENQPALEALARELGIDGAVRFAGFQDNPFAYLKQADIFVSSSRYEGFAFVIVEALACGTPVVATDCPGGAPEVIREGVNGWIAKTENVGSLAETIVRAVETAPSLNRESIREMCEARFSMPRIIAQYEEIL